MPNNSPGIRAPRANPKVPAADTASGVAARAAERMVETRMLQSRMSVGLGKDCERACIVGDVG